MVEAEVVVEEEKSEVVWCRRFGWKFKSQSPETSVSRSATRCWTSIRCGAVGVAGPVPVLLSMFSQDPTVRPPVRDQGSESGETHVCLERTS